MVSESQRAAEIFKVLSVETRVRMIELLKQRSLCVNALARSLKITSAAVSQHLRILRSVDIVIANKRGNFTHYQINLKTLARWRASTDKLLNSDLP